MSVAPLVAPLEGQGATSDFLEVFSRLKQATGTDTDTSLAEALGIKQGAVSAAKRSGQIPPSWVARVSKGFSVSADWLFYGTGMMRLAGIAPQTTQNHITNVQTTPAQLSPESVIDQEFTLVPKVKARLCAGGGSLETDGRVVGYYAFKTDFLRRKGSPKNMVLMGVVGDSMEPSLLDGDTVLIDESQNEIITGGFFAVGIESEVFVKNLDRIPGKLVLRSQNARYAPIEIDMDGDLASSVRIIGRVVWSCREYVR